MAFANAHVGLFVGVGGGGLITVSDSTAANTAAVRAASYWNQSENAANLRRRRAVEDFIELQQDGVGATGSGVPMLIVTDSAVDTDVRQARVTAAGRVTVR